MERGVIIAIAVIMDLLFADPKWLPHPIRLIGSLVKKSENFFRAVLSKSPKMEFVGGLATVIIVSGLAYLVPFLMLLGIAKVSLKLAGVVEIFMCFQILAAGSLKKESMQVYNALKSGDINLARKYLSWIVGRDTENLEEEGIVKATVETVAENTTDGVVAPLIFIAIGGAPLGFFYKAVNTMDSMIGYKNRRYFYFGKVGARLDDVLNFIPARIAAIFMVLTSKVVGLSSKNALKILVRDGNNHSSPNSGKTEAACAGALGIKLGGANYYFGNLVEKPTIGDALESAKPSHIIAANKLMYISSITVASSIILTLLLGGCL
ncbi:MAG: adenosylcobinamide-phosphate synthase CbiB [Filifactoraceae bacterium]